VKKETESYVQLEVFNMAGPSSCHTGGPKTTRMPFSKTWPWAHTLGLVVAQWVVGRTDLQSVAEW